MGRKYLSKFLAITGLVLDTKEILIILGVPTIMTGVGGTFLWYLVHIPTIFWILILLGVFLLFIAITIKIVSSLRKVNVPNKRDLLDAIAEYESRARDAFRDIGNEVIYVNASERLGQEMLKSGLTRFMDNPISLLTTFAGFQIMLRHGLLREIGNRKSLLLDEYSYIGKLRDKSEIAIKWLSKITQ